MSIVNGPASASTLQVGAITAASFTLQVRAAVFPRWPALSHAVDAERAARFDRVGLDPRAVHHS